MLEFVDSDLYFVQDENNFINPMLQVGSGSAKKKYRIRIRRAKNQRIRIRILIPVFNKRTFLYGHGTLKIKGFFDT